MTRIENVQKTQEAKPSQSVVIKPPEEEIGNIHGDSKLLGYDTGITHSGDTPETPTPTPSAAEPEKSSPTTDVAGTPEPDEVPTKNIFSENVVALPEVIVKGETAAQWREKMGPYLKKRSFDT